jgi:monoamine oxidase
MAHIGIVGGGPSGLMTAYLLTQKYGDRFRTTVFEASARVGGKLMTRSFASAPVPYEAGAAEVYDYSRVGIDSLRGLVDELGLATQPMDGQTVVFDGIVVRRDDDIERHWGASTLRSIRAFRRRAAELLPLDRWHPEYWWDDNAHPWAGRSCEELLDTVEDPVARRYLRVVAHSDLATEPHLTNGLNALKNFVLDVPGYVRCYAIQGGMTRLADGLAARLPHTDVILGARVERLEHRRDRSWRVAYQQDAKRRVGDCDAVVLALPASSLGTVEYTGAPLARAMREHIAHYDLPGHYLRCSLLFRAPFWRQALAGSWFMVDAFGGACVYDESARYDTGGYGVLGFLIAGSDALALANAPDKDVARRAIEALPEGLRHEAARHLLEARVHRWCGGVSGQPGGLPLRDPEVSHQPAAGRLPGLFVVGDYLFDSTLNAVHRSADLSTNLIGRRLSSRGTSGGSASSARGSDGRVVRGGARDGLKALLREMRVEGERGSDARVAHHVKADAVDQAQRASVGGGKG